MLFNSLKHINELRDQAFQNQYSEFDGTFINPDAVSRNKYTGASDVMGKIHRAQWEDWTKRFQPRLEQLAGYASSGELTQQSIGLADSAMKRSFGQARENQQLQNTNLGINQSAAQQNAQNRTMGLTEASSTAAARNQARIAGQDRDMQILAGSGGLKQDMG